MQLHAGARAASGEVLLFLHADSGFPEGDLREIGERLRASPELAGGSFRVVFDGEGEFSRWLAGFYAWFRRRGLYYGDSGIFVRRRVYQALGGIRPIALSSTTTSAAACNAPDRHAVLRIRRW